MKDFYIPRDMTPHEAVAQLAKRPSEELATAAVNSALNQLISNRDGGLFGDRGPMDYQGWFWRSVDFFSPTGVTIARGDGRVAVCESNKWGHPQRCLTDDERAAFLSLVWQAYQASGTGGVVSEINEAIDKKLREASDYIASLTI